MPFSITTTEGLRDGNIVLMDEKFYPPSFIVSHPVRLGPGWAKHARLDAASPFAYCPASDDVLAMLLPDGANGWRYKGDFNARRLSTGGEPIKWWLCYKEHTAEVQYVHEVQNYYEDWTGNELAPTA